MAQLHASIEKKNKNDTFWRQFDETPSHIPGCACKHSFVPAGLLKQDSTSLDPVLLNQIGCGLLSASELVLQSALEICAEGAAYLMLHRGGLHCLWLEPLAVVQRILTAGLQRTGSTVGAHLATEHLQIQAKSPVYGQCDTQKHRKATPIHCKAARHVSSS